MTRVAELPVHLASRRTLRDTISKRPVQCEIVVETAKRRTFSPLERRKADRHTLLNLIALEIGVHESRIGPVAGWRTSTHSNFLSKINDRFSSLVVAEDGAQGNSYAERNSAKRDVFLGITMIALSLL